MTLERATKRRPRRHEGHEQTKPTHLIFVYGLNRGPEGPAAHVRIYLALLPSGPDAVRRLKLHRFRTAVQPARTANTESIVRAPRLQCAHERTDDGLSADARRHLPARRGVVVRA